MRFVVLFLYCVVLTPLQVVAQRKLLKQSVHNRVIVNTPDSTLHAQVRAGEKAVPVSDNKLYYWYKADKIRTSRGGYEGKLLHGDFSQFYADLNLKEKGHFRKGLKTGEWKRWYPNGELKEISHWKKGRKQGAFHSYAEDGRLIEKKRYRKDKLKGKIIRYNPAGKAIVTYAGKKPFSWMKVPTFRKKKAASAPKITSKKQTDSIQAPAGTLMPTKKSKQKRNKKEKARPPAVTAPVSPEKQKKSKRAKRTIASDSLRTPDTHSPLLPTPH